MPTGFTERSKGKISAPVGGLFIGGIQVNTTGQDNNTQVGWGVVPTSGMSTNPFQLASSRASGVEVISPQANSGGSIFRLPRPIAGALKVLYYTTLSGSTVLFVTTSTDGSVVIAGVGSTGSTASFAGTGGTTLSNTFKSTQSYQVELIGLSSAQWLFGSIVPSTTGHLVFSTST